MVLRAFFRPIIVVVLLTLSPAACRREESAGAATLQHGSGGGVSALAAIAPPASAAVGTGAGGRAAVSPSGARSLAASPEYVRLCAACHAADGSGYAADHAPSLVNPTFLESATDEFLKASIAEGRPGTSMGAYGKSFGGPLDDAALDQLVKLLRRQGPPAKPLTAPPAGNPTAGGAIYARACKTCHGDTTARGEAVHLANSGFLKHASDAFINHAIVVGRPGTKMVAFGTALSAAQIADVVEFVRAFGKTAAPAAALLPAPTGKEPVVINPRGKDPTFTIRDKRFVGVDEVAKALAARRRLVIIDARPPSEWMRVHVAGSVSIPYHDLKRLEEIPDDVWAIAYCACPHHLSGEVVDALIKRGHKRALILDEGINEWHRRGYPVTAAPGVTKPTPEQAVPSLPPPTGGSLPSPGKAAPKAH